MTDPMTAAQFAALSPRAKGYAVYTLGMWEDQPNIPETYEPAEADRAEYKGGQFEGAIEAQDSP